MKYIDADKLIAEIDRQEIGCNIDGKHTAEYNTCRKILDIIASLQQEQSEVDLEKEIARFALNGGTGDNTPTIGETARHFYELGCRHVSVLYDDIEYERQRREAEEKDVDFDAEYAKFHLDSGDPDDAHTFPIDLADYKDFARHFYNLGLNSKK